MKEFVESGNDVHARSFGEVSGPLKGEQLTGKDHLPAMLEREPRLDPHPTMLAGLDHDSRRAIPAHHYVAHREVGLGRARRRPELGEHQALLADPTLQP